METFMLAMYASYYWRIVVGGMEISSRRSFRILAIISYFLPIVAIGPLLVRVTSRVLNFSLPIAESLIKFYDSTLSEFFPIWEYVLGFPVQGTPWFSHFFILFAFAYVGTGFIMIGGEFASRIAERLPLMKVTAAVSTTIYVVLYAYYVYSLGWLFPIPHMTQTQLIISVALLILVPACASITPLWLGKVKRKDELQKRREEIKRLSDRYNYAESMASGLDLEQLNSSSNVAEELYRSTIDFETEISQTIKEKADLLNNDSLSWREIKDVRLSLRTLFRKIDRFYASVLSLHGLELRRKFEQYRKIVNVEKEIETVENIIDKITNLESVMDQS